MVFLKKKKNIEILPISMHRKTVALATTLLLAGGLSTSVVLSLRKQNSESSKPFLSSFRIEKIPYLVFSWANTSKRLQATALSSLLLTYLARRLGLSATLRTSAWTFFVALWYLDWRMRVVEVPEVSAKGTYFNRRVISMIQSSLGKYWPCMWLSNTHFNTIGSFLIRDVEFLLYSSMHYQSQILKCYDGVNTFALDWYQPEASMRELQIHNDDSPVVIIVHGLGGSSEESYLKRLARLCHQHGWRCCSFDYWRLDFAEFRDLDIAVKAVRSSNPSAPIGVCGVSAGTHITARYLQVTGKASPCCAAVLQSSVFDMIGEYQIIKSSISKGGTSAVVARAYKQFIDSTMRKMAERHLANEKRPDFDRERLRAMLDRPHVDGDVLYDEAIWCSPQRSEWPLPPTKLAEAQSFQQRILSRKGSVKERPVFEGNDAHYAGLAGDKLAQIEVTTLMLHAVDDPIVGYHSVNWNSCLANKNIISVTTRRGGHVGWLTGLFPFGPTWADTTTVNFVRSVLEIHSSTNFILDVVQRSGLFNSKNSTCMSETKHSAHRSNNAEKIARICSASDLHGSLKSV
jgi:abhydrolase domain-containing protein 1/3